MLYTVPMHDHDVLMSMHRQLAKLLPKRSDLQLEAAMHRTLGFHDVGALVRTSDDYRVSDTQDLVGHLKVQGVKLSDSKCSLLKNFRFKGIEHLLPYILQPRGMVTEGPYEPQWTPRQSHTMLLHFLLMDVHALGLSSDMPRMHSLDLMRMFNGHLQLRGYPLALHHGEVVAAITHNILLEQWWKPADQEGVTVPLPVGMFREAFGTLMDASYEDELQEALEERE